MNYLKSTLVLSAFLFLIAQNSIAQTTISGNVYASTTWTKSGSPYIIPGNIVVFAGTVLTIEPGVTVQFGDGVTIDFRGQLIAEGTASERIFFTSNNPSPTQGIYGGFAVTGYINTSESITNQIAMSYCNVSFARNFMNLIRSCEGPFNIRHCYFYKNYNGVGDSPDCGDLYVDSCMFESNYLGVNQDENGEVYVTNCLFLNNVNGTTADNVSNSMFIGNTNVAVLAYTSLQNCEMYSNNVGAEVDVHSGTSCNYNYIHDNTIGIKLDKLAEGSGGYRQFSQNRICHNTSWNIMYTMNVNGDASNNCFCSTDSAYIRSTINDGYINSSAGLIKINVDDFCDAGIVTKVNPINTMATHTAVYPNPFYDQTTFEFDYVAGRDYTIEITDQLGRIVTSERKITSGRVTIKKANIVPGLYYYRLTSETQILGSGKLIIE